MFDYTGNWSHPYKEAGYNVIQLDRKLGVDINNINNEWLSENVFDKFKTVDIILAAPDCTHFASSGAQYWKEKDADGRTGEAVELVCQVLRTVDACMPDIWALENPVGRLPKLVPQLGKPWYFQPWWYGDPYTKKTGLWGNFNKDLPRNEVEPVKSCSQGSWLMKLGGKSERTKELRSETPMGFARSFFMANQLIKMDYDEREWDPDKMRWVICPQ
jgi:hypothetical protein